MYYFNRTDPHLLHNSTEDTLQQIFLIIAIIFLWLVIAISVPAALYSEIPIKTGEEPTTDQGSANKQTANDADWQTASTTAARLVKRALAETRESSYVYSIIAAFTIAPFLDIILIVLNAWLLVICKFHWFILCFDIAFILLSIFDGICIFVAAYINRKKLDTLRAHFLYAAGIFSPVVALQLIAFHGTFILLVFIFSPIPTACFTLIYISALFSILSAVSVMIKVIQKYHDGDVGDKKCRYAFQITVAILFAIFVVFLDALFFTTLVRDRLDYLGVNGFFGPLVLTAITAVISFVGNMLIGDNDKESNNSPSTGVRDEPTESEKKNLVKAGEDSTTDGVDYGSIQKHA